MDVNRQRMRNQIGVFFFETEKKKMSQTYCKKVVFLGEIHVCCPPRSQSQDGC